MADWQLTTTWQSPESNDVRPTSFIRVQPVCWLTRVTFLASSSIKEFSPSICSSFSPTALANDLLMRTRCGYKVPGMIFFSFKFLDSYPYTYSLLRGSPSKYSPWTAMHSAQRCCYCWRHFCNSCSEIFSVPSSYFLGNLHYPGIFVPLRQNLFF